MKKTRENIDEIIKKTLSEDEARFYEELDEQNLLQMVGGLFQGKLKWLIVLMNVVMVVFFVFFIYCVVQFFQTDDNILSLRWLGISIFCMLAVVMIKLFQWMQINNNVLLREIKRLELQISAMSKKNNT